jgi:hypothetical protein
MQFVDEFDNDEGEWTPEQLQAYTKFCEDMELINEYRTAHNISWGGPPYSQDELNYVKEKRDAR